MLSAKRNHPADQKSPVPRSANAEEERRIKQIGVVFPVSETMLVGLQKQLDFGAGAKPEKSAPLSMTSQSS